MKLFTRYCSFTVTPIHVPLILVRREWITVSRRDITTSIGRTLFTCNRPSGLDTRHPATHQVWPDLRDGTQDVNPDVNYVCPDLCNTRDAGPNGVCPAKSSPKSPKAPLIFSLSPLIRLSKSSVTTVRSFPVLFSRYTDNSTLLVVCHFLNKFSAIFWGAVHPSTLTFTSFSSSEIFPRRNRVLKTKVNSSGFMGRNLRKE